MPSFDVVSSPDLQEIDNAINNTKREVDNRFDFKNTNSTIDRSDYSITIETTDNTKLNQFNDILKNNIQISEVGYFCKTRNFGESKTSTNIFRLLGLSRPYIRMAFKARKHLKAQ